MFIISCSTMANRTSLKDIKKIYRSDKGKVIQVEVFLPNSYKKNSIQHYPVVFILDGYWQKHFFVSQYGNLRFDNHIPEMIFVSLEYPPEIESLKSQRMQDLTSVYDKGFKGGGDAEQFLQLLSEKVVPDLKSNYRIDESKTVLTGHSLAGLFTLYTMYQNTDLFTHYAAISPSALWADHYLLQFDKAFSEQRSKLNANVYITYGTGEYKPYVDAVTAYIKQLHANNYRGLKIQTAEVKDLRHIGMSSEGFLRGLMWAFSDRIPQEPSEFEKINEKANSARNKIK